MLKINGDFFWKIKKIYQNEELLEGSPVGPMRVEGAPTPLGHASCLVDSLWRPLTCSLC